MDIKRSFQIDMEDGSSVVANVILNFEYMGQNYCIYGIDSDNHVDIYCAKNIDGNLIKIVNQEEQDFVNTVVKKLTKAVHVR